jgi:hypothetical protein
MEQFRYFADCLFRDSFTSHINANSIALRNMDIFPSSVNGLTGLNNFFNGACLVALVIGVIASAVAICSRNRLQRAKDEVRLEILEIQRRRMAEKGES